MLKIRSTPTDVKWTGHMRDWLTEIRKSQSYIPAIPNMARDSVHENSLENISQDPVQSILPTRDNLRQMEKIHHIHQGLVSQQERTLESQPAHLVIFTCKDTIAPGSVDYQLRMLNFKLYIYIKARLVQNLTNVQYFTITIISIEYC